MKNKLIFLLPAMLLFAAATAFAQEEKADSLPPKPWKRTAGLGLDFAQLFQLNPRQGAGQNRIGVGGAVNMAAAYKKERFAWDNVALWQFGIQRLGTGVVAQGNVDKKIPFQKAIDELRVNSKIGYAMSKDSKLFYAADVSFLSQFTATYAGDETFPGNFLTDIVGSGANSKLFSPATITISAGFDYKPSKKLSVYYSPVGGKFIVVGNDAIAQLGVHGNPVTRDAIGNVIDYKKTFAGFGSLLRLSYADKFINERMTYGAGMVLFSNYLDNPQNIDIDWTNQFNFSIFKGLQATLLLNVFYDHDVLVQITDNTAPNGVSGLGRRVSLTQQFLLKYSLVF
jgi:hypothetical protein